MELPPVAPSRGLRSRFAAGRGVPTLENVRDASEVPDKVPGLVYTGGVVQGTDLEQRIAPLCTSPGPAADDEVCAVSIGLQLHDEVAAAQIPNAIVAHATSVMTAQTMPLAPVRDVDSLTSSNLRSNRGQPSRRPERYAHLLETWATLTGS